MAIKIVLCASVHPRLLLEEVYGWGYTYMYIYLYLFLQNDFGEIPTILLWVPPQIREFNLFNLLLNLVVGLVEYNHLRESCFAWVA